MLKWCPSSGHREPQGQQSTKAGQCGWMHKRHHTRYEASMAGECWPRARTHTYSRYFLALSMNGLRFCLLSMSAALTVHTFSSASRSSAFSWGCDGARTQGPGTQWPRWERAPQVSTRVGAAMTRGIPQRGLSSPWLRPPAHWHVPRCPNASRCTAHTHSSAGPQLCISNPNSDKQRSSDTRAQQRASMHFVSHLDPADPG
jgi:hypothetical protein